MIKLKSGKEVELKPISFFKRAEIFDQAYEMYNRGVPLSLQVCGKCIQHATGCTEKQLDEWAIEDIYDAGSQIFAELQKSDLEKKS